MSEIPSEEIEELLSGFKSQEPIQNEVSPSEEVHVDENDLREIEQKLEHHDLIDPYSLNFIDEHENQFKEHNYLLASVEILQREREEQKRISGIEQNTPQTIKFVAHMLLELSLMKYEVRLTDYLGYYNEKQIVNLSLDLQEVKDLIDEYNTKMPKVMEKTFRNYFEDVKINTDFVTIEQDLSESSIEKLRESIKRSRITLYKKYLQFGQNLLEAVALRYLYNILVLPVHFNDYFGEQYLRDVDNKHNYPITFTENNKTYMNIALFPGFFNQAPEIMTDLLTADRFGEFKAALRNINNHMEAVALNGWTNVLKGFFSEKKLKLNDNVRTVIDYVDKLDDFVSTMDDVKDAHARDKKPRPVRQTRRKIVKIEDVIEILPQIMTRLKQYKNLQKIFPKK